MKIQTKTTLAFGLILSILILSSHSSARQFRRMAPIPVAPEVLELPMLGSTVNPQLMSVENLMPIDEKVIQDALIEIVAVWNTNGLGDYLDDYFPQRFELLTMMSRDIPSDTVLELISVQSISTISQSWGNTTRPMRSQISTVIATVSLQLRFNDPVKGLVTLPHTSQFYLRVVETE